MTSENEKLPRSRAEAKAIGSKHYFTGKPCINGHLERRVTKYGTCMECSRQRSRQFKAKHPEKKKAWDRRYAGQNKDKIAANMQRWLERNPDGRKAWRDRNPDYSTNWKRANPDKVKATTKRMYERSRDDPKYKLSAAMRAGVSKGIKKGSKSARKTFELLGYSLDDLMAHLEKKFTKGMSWENYGKWHIDHVIPLSAHNYETPENMDFKRAWALNNLQPLWAKENISKHARLDSTFQPSLPF